MAPPSARVALSRGVVFNLQHGHSHARQPRHPVFFSDLIRRSNNPNRQVATYPEPKAKAALSKISRIIVVISYTNQPQQSIVEINARGSQLFRDLDRGYESVKWSVLAGAAER